jgi:hypothetical protein
MALSKWHRRKDLANAKKIALYYDHGKKQKVSVVNLEYRIVIEGNCQTHSTGISAASQ